MPDSPGPRQRVLWLSTVAFTVLFAVWLMLGVLGLEMKKDTALMLGDAAAGMSAGEIKTAVQGRFEWLLAVAILSGLAVAAELRHLGRPVRRPQHDGPASRRQRRADATGWPTPRAIRNC